MPITEYRRSLRPNTGVVFPSELTTPENLAVNAALQPLYDAGKMSRTRTVSDDGLLETLQYEFADLDTYTQYYNTKNITLDAHTHAYCQANNFGDPADRYGISGIDGPFEFILTFNFAQDTMIGETSVPTLITHVIYTYESQNSEKVQGIDYTDTSLTATFKYNNAADYTATRFNDFILSTAIAGHATKTVTFKTV